MSVPVVSGDRIHDTGVIVVVGYVRYAVAGQILGCFRLTNILSDRMEVSYRWRVKCYVVNVIQKNTGYMKVAS